MFHRAVLSPLFVLLSLQLPACSAQDPKVSTPQTTQALDIAGILAATQWKANMYNNFTGKAFTGFDGTNVFKVLLGVSVDPEFPDIDSLSEEQVIQIFDSAEFQQANIAESKKLSFEADPTFFKVTTKEETFARVYELTTLKAGVTNVKIKYAATEIPIAVQVSAYTAAQVAAGRQRYATAVAGANPSPACASCHRAETGVDHSPYSMSQFSDAALLSTIETGVNSDSKYQTLEPHKLTFSSASDREGIVSYLRSLDPESFNGEKATE